MKKYFKFVMAVLAVSALASCTDELMDNQSKLNVQEGDLVAALPAEDSGEGDATRVAVVDNGAGQFVWSDGDEIQVYELNNLKYQAYKLKEGAGQEVGVFEQKEGTGGAGSEQKYAVTQRGGSKDIYGISATTNAAGKPKPLLTAFIAPDYELETIDAMGTNAYVVPTPLWGPATINADNTISVGFKKLTAMLKVDLQQLAAGTQAIMLTTHNGAEFGDGTGTYTLTKGSGEKLSGYFNAVLDENAALRNVVLKNDPALNNSDTIRVDITKIVTAFGENTVVYIPIVAQHYDKLTLFGVMSDNIQPYKWDDVQILKEWNDQTFYNTETIPVLAETQVLDLTDPTHFNDGKIVSERIAGAIDGLHTLRVKIDPSQWTSNPDFLYIVSEKIKKPLGTNNNVEIEIVRPITREFTVAEALTTQHDPTSPYVYWDAFNYDYTYDFATCATLQERDGYGVKQMEKRRKITLTFPEGNDEVLNIITPTSAVEVNISENFKEKINAFTCARYGKGVSGYDDEQDTYNYSGAGTDNQLTNLYNSKDASFILSGGKSFLGNVNIQPNNRGDVFIYDDNTRVQRLRYLSNQNLGNLRISDALVDHIVYVEGVESYYEANHVSIFTTGAAAIKTITGKSGAPIDANKVKVYAYWTGTGDHATGKTSGKALSDLALALGFDQSEIFTAAQLQGIGLCAGLVEGGSTDEITLNNGSTKKIADLTPVYNYRISDLVANIWLGGEYYPWVGAQVAKLKGDLNEQGLTDRTIVDGTAPEYDEQKLSQSVSIDFNNKTLKKMKLSFDDPNQLDPHSCCECGPKYLRIAEDLGLIRCIMTKGYATVTNINALNDVLIETTLPISNVGSVVGEIMADYGISYYNIAVTNPRIFVAGDNVGGNVGHMRSKSGSVYIEHVLTGQEVAEPGLLVGDDVNKHEIGVTAAIADELKEVALADNDGMVYVASEGRKSSTIKNVGGLVGSIEAPVGNLNSYYTTSHLSFIAGYKGMNVGGLYGNVEYAYESYIHTYTGKATQLYGRGWAIDVPFIYATELAKNEWTLKRSGYNVGGMVGNIEGSSNLHIDGRVRAQGFIYAQNQKAGGLIGHKKVYATTFISSEQDGTADRTDVKVTRLEADNGYVGGLIAYSAGSAAGAWPGVRIGGGTNEWYKRTIENAGGTRPVEINIDLGMMYASFCAGGMIGVNEDALDISAVHRGKLVNNNDEQVKITVKIDDIANTWAAADFEGTAKKTYLTYSWTDRRKYCGTFGILIGLKQAPVQIYDRYKNEMYPINTYFDIKGNAVTNKTSAEKIMSLKKTWEATKFFTDALKDKVYFYKHDEVVNTLGLHDKKYWGDINGYVGYAKESGGYRINYDDMFGDQHYNVFTAYGE
jgi:hypothetical protein